MVATRGKKIDLKLPDSDDDSTGDSTAASKKGPSKKRSRKAKSQDANYAPSRPSASSLDPANASTKKKGSRRSGKLRDLMQMPVDIFANICTHLAPRDLRALSLTTRRLRNILMSRDSRHIWKESLCDVDGLPECPPDLNEPQYVRLMFSSDCFGCPARGALVDYYHRVRYCARCFDENFLQFIECSDDFDRAVLTLADGTDVPCEARETQKFARAERTFHKPTLLKLQAEYNAAESKEQLEASWAPRADMFVETGHAMSEFKMNASDERSQELEALKDAHEASVKKRLFELGWKPEDIPPDYYTSWNSLVRKPRQLTDRTWANLLPKLEPFLQDQRERQLRSAKYNQLCARQETMEQYYVQLVNSTFGHWIDDGVPHGHCRTWPDWTSVYHLPCIQELVQRDCDGITPQMWSEVAETVREFALKIHQDALQAIADILDDRLVDESLSALLKSKKGNTSADPNEEGNAKTTEDGNLAHSPEILAQLTRRLLKATSLFECVPCGKFLWFRDLVSHLWRCHSSTFRVGVYIQRPEERYQLLLSRLISGAGYDPETCLADTFLRGGTFTCLRCEQDPKQGTLHQIWDHYAVQPAASAPMTLARGSHDYEPQNGTARFRANHNWSLESPLISADSTDDKKPQREEREDVIGERPTEDPESNGSAPLTGEEF